MKTVEVKRDGLYLDNKKFFLVSGDFHYFRTHPDGWRRRLSLMRDFGLTAVTTYVAWNLHEQTPGEYCFEGIADLPRFLREADEEGLKVILRLSPYMCAEWEMGGLPAWLLTDRKTCVRSTDPTYMAAVTRYTRVLAEKIKPYLYTNGGPIVLLGLENEYGSFGNDHAYLPALAKLYRECGLDLPFISANGSDPFKYLNGTLPENWNGVDCSALPHGIGELERLRGYQPDKPPMAGEAWCGSIMFWGKSFSLNQNIEANVEYFRKALKMGAVVNFYMFCGGTNFAFWSGALANDKQRRYHSLMTSYDYDAPIGEDGVPREKYFALRDVLDEYLGKPARPHIAPAHPVQEISEIALSECAPLFANLDALAERTVYAQRTLCMEDLGQNYGFICYTTEIEYTDPYPRHLQIDGLCDRATVYLNGKYIGTQMRDRENTDIVFTVPEGGATLIILVENMGRIGYGYKIYDNKGILGAVRYVLDRENGSHLYNYAVTMGFRIDTLPMHSTKGVCYSADAHPNGQPAFFRGRFGAQAGVDTHLDMHGFGRGFVTVNGFPIGKFWSVGPQRTLYVPGELLKDENIIEVFELHTADIPACISCIDRAILDEMPVEDRSMEGFELL